LYRFFAQIEEFDKELATAQDLVGFDDNADLSSYSFADDNPLPKGGKPDLRKLAYRYRRIRDIYNRCVASPRGLPPSCCCCRRRARCPCADRRHVLVALQRAAAPHRPEQQLPHGQAAAQYGRVQQRLAVERAACADRAVREGARLIAASSLRSLAPRALLRFLSRAQYHAVHALVTSTQVIPALAKCILFGLDVHFPVELVYSARSKSKGDCFREIAKKCVPVLLASVLPCLTRC
jgi:hypothetical protein